MSEDIGQLVWEAQKLVWDGRQEALSHYPPIPTTTWAGSVQHDIISFDRASDNLRWPPLQQIPHPQVAVVMMVKDEADIIRDNLQWLYFVGVRRFVVMDNGSSDATSEIIMEFDKASEDAELIYIHDPIVHYFQKEKTTGMFHFARSLWPDLKWIFPIDADEFLIPQRGLNSLEELSPDIDAITIPKVIHYLSRNSLGDGKSLFDMPIRSQLYVVPPKSAARVNPEASIEQGNHFISLANGESPSYASGLHLGLYYREFPTRSFAQFLRKVRNGGAAVLAAKRYNPLRPAGGDHWISYYETLVNGGEEALFQVFQAQFVRHPNADYMADPFPGCRQDNNTKTLAR